MPTLETKIRTKIDERFSTYLPSDALTELKEELIADLHEIASEQLSNRKTESEAVTLAFQYLGDTEALMQELEESKQTTLQVNLDEGKQSQFDDIQPVHQNKTRVFNHLKCVNSVQYDLSIINEISIRYKDDQIELKQSPNDMLTINEYMSRKNQRYYLNETSDNSDQLTINSGNRPILWHIRTRIEICIPQKYAGKINILNKNGHILTSAINSAADLSLTASNGAIKVENAKINQLTLFCANGAIKLQNINTDETIINANNGSISGINLTGIYSVKARNGAIKLSMLNGGGHFASNNGAVKVAFNQITSAINTYTKNGAIKMTIPADANVAFNLHSKIGSVTNKLSGAKITLKESGKITGALTNQPLYEISSTSEHGNITLQ